MDEETEQPSTFLSIATPELLKAVTAATGDQGAACRPLRATGSQLRELLPATFPDPLVIQLAADENTVTATAAAAGQRSDASAEAAADATAADTAAQSSPASNAAAAPTPAQQDAQSRQCGWPLLQLWQQYQQKGKAQHMLLPEVHLKLGPNLPWVPGNSSSSSSSGDLPDLLLPHCSLLQQQEFLQQMRSLTVTYAHAGAAAATEGSTQQQGGRNGCTSAALASCPASNFAAGLLKSQTPLTSFTLHPEDALYGAPFWLQPNQPPQGSIAGSNAASSSSSSSRAKWHSPGPCAVMLPQRAALMGSAVLGSQWLPHLLQLPQLKHLTLPVVWVTDKQQQTQELDALRADLSAAAAAAARDSSAATSGGPTSPLETLQLLLVPACLKRGLKVLQTASTAEDAYCSEFCPKSLQQLLQVLLLELPQLQRLHLCVLGNNAWAGLEEAASIVARQSSSLRSLTIAEIAGDDVFGDDLLFVHGLTWDCGSSCSVTAVQGSLGLLRAAHTQPQQLALRVVTLPAVNPPIDAALLEHVTQLQLAIPQTLLPHLTSLLPDASAAESGSSSSKRWRNMQTMQLCLDGGALDDADSDLRKWPVPTHAEQQNALQLLLRASRCLRVLRLQGSTRAGVTMLGQLAPLATTAAGTLEELHLLHAVPQHNMGTIPHLHEFRQLRVLTLAAPAMAMNRLALHTLPPTLQQLHLEGFSVSCELAPSSGWAESYTSMQQHAAQLVQSAFATAVEAEQQQSDQPAAAAAAPATPAVAQDGKAAAAVAAGENAAAFMRPEFEHVRALALPTLVEVMPQLQRLHLINCAAFSVSLALLLEWAGPSLQELVLAQVHCNDLGAATSDVQSAAVRLLHLRRFDWVECKLPLVTDGAAVSLSQLLAFVHASAPQLQQLKVAADETQPLLDWHVPLLLRMQQLRRLEAFVGPDVTGEITARFEQRTAASTAAGTAVAPVPQQQQQRQLPEVLAAMQNMQLHATQAARYAQQVQRLTNSHVAAGAEFTEDFNPDADDPGLEVMTRALGYANSLLGSEGVRDLAGMTAAAAAQLQQGLPAGGCGTVVLHRQWDVEGVVEYMYSPHRDRDAGW